MRRCFTLVSASQEVHRVLGERGREWGLPEQGVQVKAGPQSFMEELWGLPTRG